MRVHIDDDDRAFLEGFKAGFEELRLQSHEAIEHIADKVVDRAKELAPKRTGGLTESIDRGPLVRDARGAYIEVHAGGPGIRETIYMEFGTYKDRPRAYFRTALAEAGGVLRSVGFAARLEASGRSRMAAKRARARADVRRRFRRGELTAAQTRAASRDISNRMRFRAQRGRGRRGPA